MNFPGCLAEPLDEKIHAKRRAAESPSSCVNDGIPSIDQEPVPDASVEQVSGRNSAKANLPTQSFVGDQAPDQDADASLKPLTAEVRSTV